MTKTFGLVCEGKADFVVIEHLLRDHFSRQREELSFRRLQPHSDATGKLTEGGWRQVFQWCIRNTSKHRTSLFSEEQIFSISEIRSIDILVIHLDADVCEDLKASDIKSIDHIRDLPTDGPAERAHFVRCCMASWLGITLDAATKARHVLAVPVESTEAWLIAGHIEEDVEACRDLMEKCCAIIYDALKLKKPMDGKKIKKKPDIYERFIEARSVTAEKAHEKCTSFKDLISATSAVFELDA